VGKKLSILVLISNEQYLRNWIKAGAFSQLEQDHNVHYLVAREYWDPAKMRDVGVENYIVLDQPSYRKFFFRRLLTVTMYKYIKRSRAFEIKLRGVRPELRNLYKFLACPGVFQTFLSVMNLVLPKWDALTDVIKDRKPDILLAPSIAADSFTIDMTYTAKCLDVKSILLINSWDNLVSKGVLPILPDKVVVWGEQGAKQAEIVQDTSRDKIEILGLPRFESYFNQKNLDDKLSAFRKLNEIPEGKKVIFYATTSLPYDDVAALEFLDQQISENPKLKDYIVLFRPHPEMMQRAGEKNVFECDFKNVVLDRQVSDFYTSRFKAEDHDYPSFINDTELEYYPVLMNVVSLMVCPPTTMALEAALNGIPALVLCYPDGKNQGLTAEKTAHYGYFDELFEAPGILPCWEQKNYPKLFEKLITLSEDKEIAEALRKASEYIVYKDEQPYAERLSKIVEKTCA